MCYSNIPVKLVPENVWRAPGRAPEAFGERFPLPTSWLRRLFIFQKWGGTLCYSSIPAKLVPGSVWRAAGRAPEAFGERLFISKLVATATFIFQKWWGNAVLQQHSSKTHAGKRLASARARTRSVWRATFDFQNQFATLRGDAPYTGRRITAHGRRITAHGHRLDAITSIPRPCAVIRRPVYGASPLSVAH